jgi:hypothetical protein
MVTKDQIEVLASQCGLTVKFKYSSKTSRWTCTLENEHGTQFFSTLADAKMHMLNN